MINFFLDQESYELLNEWSAEHRWKVVNALPFDRKMNVHLKNGSAETIGFFQAYSKGGYKFSLKDTVSRIQIAKGTVMLNNIEGESDFDIKYTLTTDADAGVLNPIVRCAVNSLLLSNAFLWYGNLDENRALKTFSKNNENGKSVVFKTYNNELYAVPFGSHRSPQGVFNVRGHFRFYKSTGKVVWIDSYFKGVEN